MLITKLEYQKKNPNRVSVFVDGEFAVGISANDVIKLGLYKDQEITQEELNKIISESNFGKAFNLAINYISYRPRSEWEVRDHLKKKDCEDIDTVIEKLKKIGQINDDEFAKWWVDQRSTFRPKGSQMLNLELRRKGIKTKVKIENEFELAMRVASKGAKDREKLARRLASRGFSWDIIKEVVDKIFGKRYNDD